jgi:hypothetical protein
MNHYQNGHFSFRCRRHDVPLEIWISMKAKLAYEANKEENNVHEIK